MSHALEDVVDVSVKDVEDGSLTDVVDDVPQVVEDGS